MAHIINLAIITALCVALTFVSEPQLLLVLSVLIFVLLASLPLFFAYSKQENIKQRSDLLCQVVYLALLIVGFFLPGVLFGLPLVAYQVSDWKRNWPLLLTVIPLMNAEISALQIALLYGVTLIAIFLGYWTRRTDSLEKSHYSYVDTSSELLRRQRQLNHQLMAQRELDRASDILAERNRIARSIHDNVGHKLTSAILQVAELDLLAADEQAQYSSLRETLSEAMEMIRNSIHDIHTESLSIETALEKLAHDFKFCPLHCSVQINDQLSPTLFYTVLAICREGLNNTAKHSNASRVSISLKQWGDHYQLLLADNGYTIGGKPQTDGIGLLSLEERVTAIGGTLNVNRQSGYRIFARLPAKSDAMPETET
ncbi:MAG TPA: sensor histidine kinase [Fastidiosipila sp.]|nr:sensor histidine kinase [Fastidiosipila sp.]